MSGTFPPASAPSTLRGELKAFRIGSIPAGWTQTSGPATDASGYVPCELLPLLLNAPETNVRLATSGGVLYCLYGSAAGQRFEKFDEAAGVWVALPGPGLSSASGFANGPLITLPSGKLLHAYPSGTSNTTSARIFDPATATWSPAANLPMQSRSGGGYLMADGRAYVCNSSGGAYAYDEALNTWTARAVPPAPTTIYRGSNITSLGNGNALLVEGTSYYIYDEATDTWSAARTLQNGLSVAFDNAIFKVGGKVLASISSGLSVETYLRAYDIATDTWTLTSEATVGCSAGSAAQLSDGAWCWPTQAASRRIVRRSTTALPTAIVWAVKDN